MPLTNDIIIIGAGIVGCSIAFELSGRGAAIQVVDDRPAGMGATQASAGILAPYIEARERAPLLDLAARSLDLFETFVSRAASASGVEVTYRRTGTLDVALHSGTAERLRAAAAEINGLGVSAEFLDGDAARLAEPQLSGEVLGGLMIPSHGYVAASQLTAALVSAARRQGAHFIEQARVLSIKPADGEIVVETSRGTLRAHSVVLAAGSWAGRIEIEGVEPPPPIKPIRGQLVQLKWTGTPLRRVIWGERCYLVPWDDGTLLVGATVEDAGFDERTTAAGVHDLIEACADLVPRAWTAGFTAARVGLRPASPDELPMIGPSSVIPNLMYACGHYRNGVLLAPLTARLVADRMLEQIDDPLMALTMPSRFGTY